jgi:hypothetical protein
MALAIRFIPNAGRAVIYTPSGRTSNVTGPTVDIPFPDADAVATDQAARLMVVGASEDRPVGGPRPDRLAAARDVRHDARRADLSGSGIVPGEVGGYYGLASLTGDRLAEGRVILASPPSDFLHKEQHEAQQTGAEQTPRLPPV